MLGNAKHKCLERNFARQLLEQSREREDLGPFHCLLTRPSHGCTHAAGQGCSVPFKHPAQCGCCELCREGEHGRLQNHPKWKVRFQASCLALKEKKKLNSWLLFCVAIATEVALASAVWRASAGYNVVGTGGATRRCSQGGQHLPHRHHRKASHSKEKREKTFFPTVSSSSAGSY